MTEAARQIINDAMDIHGGRGIMLGPRNYLGRVYEALPISITVEGANILTRCLIIFGQGAIRCHPYVLKEMYAVMDPDKQHGLVEFDKTFFAHIRYTISNTLKLKLHFLSGMAFCSAPEEDRAWKKYYKRFSFFSLALAVCADFAMLILGGDLKRKENLSARLGDVLSYLYMASAVLKYNHDNGNPEAEKPYVQWTLDYCLYNIHKSLEGFLINFPVRILGKSLQWIIFPFWFKYRMSKDKVDLTISRDMMQDTELRTRLARDCIAVDNVENAWRTMLTVEPLLDMVREGVKQGAIDKNLPQEQRVAAALEQKIITQQDAELLREFLGMQLDVLQVDEFTQAELTGR